MSTYPKMERADGGQDLYRCGNCAAEWPFEQLKDMPDLMQRVSSGEELPAGECPDCGALCHPVMGHAERMHRPPTVIVTDGPKLQVVATGQLTASEARDLARTLDRMAEQIEPTPHGAAYLKAAQAQHRDGELEIDAHARISDGADDGVYVEAWLWVSMEDAGLATRCDECDELIPTEPQTGGLESLHHAESCSLYNADKE